MITEEAGTETGSPGLDGEGQRLAGHREGDHAAPLQGHDLEAGPLASEPGVAGLQALLAGQEVGRLHEDRLVRHLHERDLALLVGEDEAPLR
jgi:hypothetical protein